MCAAPLISSYSHNFYPGSQLFDAGKTPILLATDIAARGIHVNNVYYVVNYDFPGSLDQVSLTEMVMMMLS